MYYCYNLASFAALYSSALNRSNHQFTGGKTVRAIWQWIGEKLGWLTPPAPAEPPPPPQYNLSISLLELDPRQLRKLEQRVIRGILKLMHQHCYEPPPGEPPPPYNVLDAARDLLTTKPEFIQQLLSVPYTDINYMGTEHPASAWDEVVALCIRVMSYIALQDMDIQLLQETRAHNHATLVIAWERSASPVAPPPPPPPPPVSVTPASVGEPLVWGPPATTPGTRF